MASRNELLEQIVIAVGGIVRDPNNRNSLLEDWLLAVDNPVIQRIFINNDDAAGAFYSMATPIVMASNFTAGTKAILPLSATNYTLIGQTASALNYLKILSTGFASISIDGDVVTSTVLATKDSKLRDYSVELNGNDFEFLEDAVIIDTITDAVAAAKVFTINAISTSNGADRFDGIQADPFFDNAGTITSWNLDEATANTETNNEGGNVLTYENQALDQRELFTLTDGDWVGQDLGSLAPQPGITVVGDLVSGTVGAFAFITSNASFVEADASYLVTVTNNTSSDIIRIRDGAGDLTGDMTGNFTVTVTPSDTSFILTSRGAGYSGSFNITVQRVVAIA